MVGVSLDVVDSGPSRIGPNRDAFVDRVIGCLHAAEGGVRGFIEVRGKDKRGDSHSDQEQTEDEKQIDGTVDAGGIVRPSVDSATTFSHATAVVAANLEATSNLEQKNESGKAPQR